MKKIALPSKFRFIDKIYKKGQPFTLLDVGAGNHSATNTKKWFPACKYYGLDIDKNYNNNARDFELMDGFYEKDLTKLEFDDIPNEAFDVIMMAHIIEHLPNGDEVIKALAPKLKRGGYIYIEYPGMKSTELPSRKDTLNFFDDYTHVRIYSLREMYNLLMAKDFKILRGGIRRDWRVMVLMPIKLIHNKIKYGFVMSSNFWDFFGFAEYVFAQKKELK